MTRTVAEVVEAQWDEPVFLTNGTLDDMLEELGPPVFEALGLVPGLNQDFWPMSPFEEDFVGEDWGQGPYGGVSLAYAVLYRGRKWLAPLVEVCFDGPGRPFSVPSYGDTPDAIYEDREAALREAHRLAGFLRPKVEAVGGHVRLDPDFEVDRHAVLMMFDPGFAVRMCRPFGATTNKLSVWKIWLEGVFLGYQPTPSKIERTAKP